MSDLSNSITDYYFAKWATLPLDKQFHFASRLYLWSRDERASYHLYDGDLQPFFTADGKPDEALRAIIVESQQSIIHGSKNAAELRRPYFERYPKLKLYVSLLFRTTFLRSIYNLDARDSLLKLVSTDEFESYETKLLADPDAIAILSTHAINFLYLYERVVKGNDESLNPEQFLTIGKRNYDRSQPIYLQLLIYLYTHCIIGESNFYYRRPVSYLEVYRHMLDELEKLITERYDDINLDNKFEYLVCCRLLQQPSQLQWRIYEEAERSVSVDGTFLVDRHNNNPQTANSTLDLSEHRNVLFALANRDFEPLAAV